MPLKHSTETWLVALLGVAIVLAGVACAILPSPVHAPLLWILLFAVSLAYPLSLYPLFQARRADYEFRVLHFLPALILFVWLILELLLSYIPSIGGLMSAYRWGWSLPAVLGSLAALVWYCLHVIRQRAARLRFLALLFVPFVILGILGENFQWPEQLASVLSGSSSSIVTGSGTTIIAGTVSSETSSNLNPSSDPDEEKLRMALRRQERRKARLLEMQNEPVAVHGAKDGIAMIGRYSSLIAANIPGGTNPPPHLPSSGIGGVEAVALMFVAAYCAILHERARRRTIA